MASGHIHRHHRHHVEVFGSRSGASSTNPRCALVCVLDRKKLKSGVYLSMARFSWMYCLIASLWLNQDLISDNRPAISAVPARAVVTWKQGWHPRVTPCEGTRAYSRKHTHTDTYVYIKRTLTIWRHKSLQLHTLFFFFFFLFFLSLCSLIPLNTPHFTLTHLQGWFPWRQL